MTAPKRAMILAAGRGERMRPLTDRVPKPVIPVAGRSALDRMLDRLAGLELVVVNACHLAERIEAAVAARHDPPVIVVREERVLGTGGGVANALGLLGEEPFLVANGDVFLSESPGQAVLETLVGAWDGDSTDALLLLVERERARGYRYAGDFSMTDGSRLVARGGRDTAPFVYASVQIVHPRLLEGAPEGAFSFTLLWDRAARRGRLRGVVWDGGWMTVDTIDNLAAAGEWLATPIRNHEQGFDRSA
ncbi:MAG: nucleotidyltransferase family protein [bacterium]|nr:nucleotidyltransferase family protein [bacterium]